MTTLLLLLELLLLLLLYVGCVQALLTAGASVDLPMCNPSRQHSELPVVNGSTALHLAADYGHTAIASLLLHAHVRTVMYPSLFTRLAALHGAGQSDQSPVQGARLLYVTVLKTSLLVTGCMSPRTMAWLRLTAQERTLDRLVAQVHCIYATTVYVVGIAGNACGRLCP
jgi:hypothetical protein